MNCHQKQFKQQYKQDNRPMGVFQIRNLLNDRIFLVVGINLRGIMNSHRFQLEAGVHRNRQLQADWNQHGPHNLVFEILDQMNPAADSVSSRRDLLELEEMWLTKLQPFGEHGYNERKLTRAELLHQMAERRTTDE